MRLVIGKSGNRIGLAGLALALLLPFALTGYGTARADDRPGFPPPRVRAWQTGLLRPDRLQHASLALSSGLSIGLLTQEPAAAAGSAMAIGLLKELWDMRRSRFDVVDLAADGIGAGLSAAGTAVLRR